MSFPYTKGVWFGPRAEESGIEALLAARRDAHIPLERAAASLDLFKAGDFGGKPDILRAMDAAEPKVRDALCHIYCSVATHEDVKGLIETLDENDEQDVYSFGVYGSFTLSLHTIPYLLSWAEVWEGTRLEERLIDCCRILYPLYTDQESRLREVAPYYQEVLGKVDLSQYYYYGQRAFAGDITKDLIQRAAQARFEKRELRAKAPYLLSVWSGIKCPVDYASVIDDPTFGEILEYVKKIASTPWLKGQKYFYGHCVGEGKSAGRRNETDAGHRIEQ